MKIAIFSAKGGAGKSTISVLLQEQLGIDDTYIFSNDQRGTWHKYEHYIKIDPDTKLYEYEYENGHTIYDFRGDVTPDVIETVKSCDLVIVPCTEDHNFIAEAIETVRALLDHQENILLVQTAYVDDKDIEHFMDGNGLSHIPLHRIRMVPKGLKEAFKDGISIEAHARKFPSGQYMFRGILADVRELGMIAKAAGGIA